MEWAYVAGYFDGEGSVRFKDAPSRPGYILVGLSWANTHLKSLEAIRDFIQCGVISHHKRKEPRKQMYSLSVERAEDILRVGELMLPYLIVKREQAERMLEWVKENRKSQSEAWGVLAAVGVEEISRLYWEEGLKQREIAEKFGCGDGAVSTFFVRNGIRGRRTGPDEGAYGIIAQHGSAKLFAMYESGMTIGQIAEELGVRYGTVYMHFYNKGIRLTKKVRKARVQRNGKG